MADVDKAISRMDKVVMLWFGRDQMLLQTWVLMRKIPDPSQTTVGIDTRSIEPCIRFNPNFINSLNDEVLEHIMANLCLKLLLRHPTSRLRDPAEITALASDIVVNPIVMKDMPNIDGIREVMPTSKMFKLAENETFEEYFRNCMEDLEETTDLIISKFGKRSDAIPKTDDDGYVIFESQKFAIKEMMDPRSDTNKNWQEHKMLDADITNLVNGNRGDLKAWGSYTGQALSQIVAANTPKISWREILRRFNTSVQSMATLPSRRKVNRRFDLDAAGRRRVFKTKVIFAVDCSGSMSDDDLKEGFAVINSICRHAEIIYVLFDTEIKLVETKFRNAKDNFKVLGRGGTDFELVCRYADEHSADGLIIYTDGGAAAPIPPKRTKVLWLLTNNKLKAPVTWGFHAHLDRTA